MKIKNICSLIAIAILVATSIAAYGQNEKNRVTLKGTAVMVSDNAADWGLEVAGKLVVGKTYKNFKTPDGKFFAVEAKDGKMGVCNDKGEFIFPCKYFKTAVSGSYITIYEEAGKPKFYKKDNPTVEIQPKEMGQAKLQEEIDSKAPAGTVINVTKTIHRKAEEFANTASTQAPYGAFSFRTNKDNKQELLVDDKVIFTAATFESISDVKYYDKTKCWLFRVTDYPGTYQERYGVFCLAIYEKEGNKIIEQELTVPIRFQFIEFVDGSTYWLKCTEPGFGGTKTISIWGLTREEYKKKYSKFYDVDATCAADSRLKIKQVIVGDNTTEVVMEFTQTGESGNFKIERPDGFQNELLYFVEANGKQHKLLRYSSDLDRLGKAHVANGKTLTFTLIFDKLPDGTTQFNLIEGSQGTRHIKNIVLKEQQ